MSEGERNDKGQFVAGNPGGPGRPKRTTEAEYLAAIAEAVSLADWREIVGRARADALAGDGKARDWLARYLVGDPAPGALQTLAALANLIDPPEAALTEAEAGRILRAGGAPAWQIGSLSLPEQAISDALRAADENEAEEQAEKRREKRAAAAARRAERLALAAQESGEAERERLTQSG